MDTSRIKNERLLASAKKMEQRVLAIESAHQILLEKLLDLEDEVHGVHVQNEEKKEIESAEDTLHEIENQEDQINDEDPLDISEETLMSRDELKEKATALGIEFKNNIPTDKLIVLIQENKGEI